MISLDLLREEMERRGCNKSQIESNTAAIVLDILSHSNGEYAYIAGEEKKESNLLQKLKFDIKKLNSDKQALEVTIFNLKERWKELEKQKKDFDEYVSKVKQELSECNTEQGKDAIRKAQMFINSVSVNSKYDNTAYIIALGAILSGGKYDGVEELKKMNPKLFGGDNAD